MPFLPPNQRAYIYIVVVADLTVRMLFSGPESLPRNAHHSPGKIRFVHLLKVPWAHASPQPKWTWDRFIRVFAGLTVVINEETQRPGSSVTIGRIL